MRFRKLGLFLVLTVFLSLLLTYATALGGTVGKISGVVTDENNEPIPGASVRIDGTSMGAAANFDGSFVILNVPPGTYTLVAQTVGYNKYTVEQVEVQVDVTTEQNFKLTSSAIKVDSITVIAPRKSIDKYITTNQIKMTADQIKDMPITNTSDLLRVTPGFVSEGGLLHARGGRGGEISFMVDGMEIRDPQGGYGSAMRQEVNISATDIEELSVLKGSFDAEYGGVNSAIINVVRKSGKVETTSGRIEYLTDDFGFNALNKYSFNSDRLEWNLSGPVPLISDQLFPKLGLKWPGEKMSYFMSFYTDKSNNYVDYNGYSSPNSKIDYGSEKFLGINIPNRRSNQYAASGKLSWKMDANAKYRLSLNYWKQWQNFTGFSWPFLYSPQTAPWQKESKEIYGFSFEFSPSFLKNTFGELKVNRFVQNYEQRPGSRTPGDFLNADNYESYADSNKNGRWDPAEPFIDANGDGFFGEPFQDYNGDGIYDPRMDLWQGIEIIYSPDTLVPPETLWHDDLNHNGRYDANLGNPFTDLNGNGRWDPAEPITNDHYFFDYNHNGVFDHNGDPFVDVNHNGVWDPEPFTDLNGNRKYDYAEPFDDVNHNGIWDSGEAFNDVNQNGVWDNAEPYVDSDGNGQYTDEPYTDITGDGRYTPGDFAYLDASGRGNGIFDPQLRDVTNQDNAEPYTDGDVIIGEPYIDVDLNGEFNGRPNDASGPDIFLGAWDYNHNGKHDGPKDPWSPGVPYRDLNNNGRYDAPDGYYNFGEPFVDLNGNGIWDGTDGFWDLGYDQWALWEQTRSVVNTFRLDLTSQVSKQHEIKSGIEFKDMNLDMNEIQYPDYTYDGQADGGAWPDRGIFRDFYQRTPKQGSFYIRDKMEYGEMIANLGMRYDFYLQAAEVKGVNYASQNLAGKPIKDTQNKFSPRVAFSFPVSDKAKLYFNYGHFYQLPDLWRFFIRPTQASNAAGIVGNPNLDFTKTIQYELGIQYSVMRGYVLDISGFYKDYYGLLNSIAEVLGPITNDVYGNIDYARTRGFEVELEKRTGANLAGSVDYQYTWAFGKNSSESADYFARYNRQEIPIQENPLDWDIRHQVTVNMDVRALKKEHPKFGILTLPDDWTFNVIWQFKTGKPFTPDSKYPGLNLIGFRDKPLTNSMRMSNFSTVDVRFDKNFQVWKLNYTATLRVQNLFDTRNVIDVYGTTGFPLTNVNLNGQIYTGLPRDANPGNLDAGRQIQFGMSLNF